MPDVLKDRVAIVTGAGRGLGKAFSLRFAAEGARLVVADIDGESAAATAEEIEAGGGEAIAVTADVAEEKDVAGIVNGAMAGYGRVDVLLNDAGLADGKYGRPWDGWKVAEWDRMFAVNVRGTYLCCRAVAPVMMKQGKGKIINIASDLPRLPGAHTFLAYACSKGAIYTLTQALARALGPSGINVNAIGPGLTDTEGTRNMRHHDEAFAATLAGQAIKRGEVPEDLVGTAVFLASADADFIAGQIIMVNGGCYMA